MRIAIFDSGVGGFSILRELLPSPNTYLYLADQAYFPYGDKPSEQIAERVGLIASWIKKQNPDIVVMACNTATVSGIDKLRSILSCPVVGVEPVVKPAAKYGKSLIIGTEPTLNSLRMRQLLAAHPGSVLTYCPNGLAGAIENINIDQVKKIIHEISKVVQNEKIEAIGLSCTHYPLIKDLLQESLPGITIIDPSQAVAKQVLRKLEFENLMKIENWNLKISFCTTGDVLRFNYQISHYLGITAQSSKVTI